MFATRRAIFARRPQLLIQPQFMPLSTVQAQQPPLQLRANTRTHSQFNYMYFFGPVAFLYLMSQKQSEEPSECEGVSRADKIRGAYENKIRFFAPPEKMFEIFSTLKTSEGEMRMSYADFLQTMTPYNHGKLQEKEFIEEYVKEHTPRILTKVDVNKDGEISFTEFFFFLLLL